MNKHALEILTRLAEWYREGEVGPQAGSLLFEDERTLQEHIEAALAGLK